MSFFLSPCSSQSGFFDFYIIPLAKKLQESGVFGEYGDEYVKNTQANRDEWVACGKDVVAEMMDKVKSMKLKKRKLRPGHGLRRAGSETSLGGLSKGSRNSALCDGA